MSQKLQKAKARNNSDSFHSFEYIDVPVGTATSTYSLKIDLLQKQIEYTKRDLYHRELLIFEKGKSLALSDDDRNRLLKNSEAVFSQREKFD